MKNAVSPKPGSPAHKEAAALKESVAALQADVAHLKDQVASRDARIDIQNTENSKLVAEASKQAELLKTVRNRNAALVVERINVADENKGLKASIAELQAKTDSLNAFKQTHLREGQPMLVELMTLENRVDNKMDEQAARRAAKLRYVATYGIPVEDSDDGEHFTWED
jgi:chromosome segregation ATPase